MSCAIALSLTSPYIIPPGLLLRSHWQCPYSSQHAVRKMVIEQSMKVELTEFETVVEKGSTVYSN